MADIQKDLVLDPGSYAFVLDETKGNIACWVGPSKTSLSQSDTLVVFNSKSKQFVPCDRYSDAIQKFVTVPEGWYVALKNPAPDNKHPTPGTSNTIPEKMEIGRKVNTSGPANFALYPGQMAQVIRGHSLRSNQYLIAKVYDADSLNKDKVFTEEILPYFNGQTLVIKGTEVSFYIPPTGIEVKPIDNNPKNGYVRDAVTLERLEYCMLKDEDGNRRYVHGPAVVFPTPTESFIQDSNGHIRRNAIELSDISGVYIKVIADYKDEDGKEHKTGEELFITGKNQMIYYPRPEHTFISYNGKILHHAIAIPKGEGRYVMNRLTGEIKTVRGPAMYLPDPRVEVIIKRTLSRSQCELWYPGNSEVLAANGHFFANTEGTFVPADTAINQVATFGNTSMTALTKGYYNGIPMEQEQNKINRSNTFTQPRTISLDSSKYEGAVTVDVWTGYAVNVISKDGSREVIKGPRTVTLDYDQTLDALELSTGKPKTTDRLERVAFLRYENNRVSDIINVETSDFVKAAIKVSYNVNFDEAEVDRWFSIDNYVKHLCDWARSVIKKTVKEFNITDLYNGYHEIVVKALVDEDAVKGEYLHKFGENGMMISDVEVMSLDIEPTVKRLMEDHQAKIVAQVLQLNATQSSAEAEKQIVELNREKVRLAEDLKRYKIESEAATKEAEFNIKVQAQKNLDEENKRKCEIAHEIEELKNALFEEEQKRLAKEREAELVHKEKLVALDIKREAASASAMQTVLEALGPDLAASMASEGNRNTLTAIAEAISPYALAEGESVASAVDRLLRGSSFEGLLDQFMKKQ